jgi:hypothetical protein
MLLYGCLIPGDLTCIALGMDEICLCTDPEVRKYLRRPHKRWSAPARPAAVYPARRFKRIAAQCGFFTIHGNYQPLEKAVPKKELPMLSRIVIPAKALPDIRRDLRHLGITHGTIFPDLDGLAKAVRREWIDDNVPR